MQARDRLKAQSGYDDAIRLNLGLVESVLFRAASTIQTLEQEIKASEATATRYAEALAGRTATLRYISIGIYNCDGGTEWGIVDTERQRVIANAPAQEDANQIAALLNKV